MSRKLFGLTHNAYAFSICAATLSFCWQAAGAAESAVSPIKNISAETSNDVIVQFSNDDFPKAPQILDLPGPNHRIVFDFVDASLDSDHLAAADKLSDQLAAQIPSIKSIRYSNLENTAKPTARIVIDLPEELKAKPHVVKLEQGAVTLNLGLSAKHLPAVAKNNATETAAPKQAAAAPKKPDLLAQASTKSEWGWGNDNDGAASFATSDATSEASSQAVNSHPAVQQSEPPVAELKPALPETEGDNSQSTAPSTEAFSNPAGGTPEGAPAPQASTQVPADEAAAANKETTGDAVKTYNKAVQFHLSGKLAEAIAEYKKSLELNPALAEAHSNLGLIFNQQHNYAQAISEFRKALAINPKDAITYNGIGAALRAEKDLPGAIKNWQTAVSLDPKLATAHYNLGTAYELQKDYEKALASYRSAVKNDYRLGEAYYRMGLILRKTGKPEEAISQFKESLKISGDSEYSEDARHNLATLAGKKN